MLSFVCGAYECRVDIPPNLDLNFNPTDSFALMLSSNDTFAVLSFFSFLYFFSAIVSFSFTLEASYRPLLVRYLLISHRFFSFNELRSFWMVAKGSERKERSPIVATRVLSIVENSILHPKYCTSPLRVLVFHRAIARRNFRNNERRLEEDCGKSKTGFHRHNDIKLICYSDAQAIS